VDGWPLQKISGMADSGSALNHCPPRAGGVKGLRLHISPWKENAMIRLKGQEAVNQAYYAMNNKEVLGDFSRFYLETPEKKVLLSPEEALQALKGRKATSEDLVCDVLSVWDTLLVAEEEGAICIHPCRNSVLVFNRDTGPEVGPGIRAFAVALSAFEKAAGWAMQSPVIDRDYDLEKFILKLYPRMLLRKGNWQQDVDLLRHSIEISQELIRICRLDSGALWDDLLHGRSALFADGEPLVDGGLLLDAVLESVWMTIESGFTMKDMGCVLAAPLPGPEVAP